MLKGGQDVDPNKTANDIFKMRYGVPIQGANFDTKWVIKASGNSPAALSQEEWPELSSVTSAKNSKQGKMPAKKTSNDEVDEPAVFSNE